MLKPLRYTLTIILGCLGFFYTSTGLTKIEYGLAGIAGSSGVTRAESKEVNIMFVIALLCLIMLAMLYIFAKNFYALGVVSWLFTILLLFLGIVQAGVSKSYNSDINNVINTGLQMIFNQRIYVIIEVLILAILLGTLVYLTYYEYENKK